MLAQRTQLFAASGTAQARAAAKAAADAGKEIIDLTAGEIWADLAPTLHAGALDALNKSISRYSDTTGTAELRAAIARNLESTTGQPWSADEVAVTTGAKQALFNAAMVLFNPGDEVLIPSPHWTTFPAQVLIAGARPVFVDTRSSGYVPTIEALQEALSDKTRAIIVNTPNNPTGAVYNREALLAIASFAIEHNLWLIFDECYGAFTYEPHAHHALLSLIPDIRSRLLIVNAYSKQLAITGWRIGYLAGPRATIKAAKALQSHTTSNPNVVAQHAVLAHLQNSDGRYEAQLLARLREARERGLKVLAGLKSIRPPTAQGGFYFYLDTSALLANADEVTHHLLARAGVACVSGSAFGDPSGIRVSYGIPVERLEKGLQRLVDTLNAYT